MADMPSLDSTALVSQALYARMRGCARQTVFDRVVAGQITTFGPEKLICPKLAQIQWADNVRTRLPKQAELLTAPGAPGTAETTSRQPGPFEAAFPKGEGEESYAAASARMQRVNADRAEMLLARERGELVPFASAERAVFDAFRVLRDRVLGAAKRCAPELLNQGDIRVVEQLVVDEMRKALTLSALESEELPEAMVASLERMKE